LYLDILDAGLLLCVPPCHIRLLAETGAIPAHALRHEGETCWKFRLNELLSWAAEMCVEISRKAVCSFLSRDHAPR